MKEDDRNWAKVTPPEEKTLSQCASHGADHAAYRWVRRPDGRWNDAQIAAYRQGYDRQLEYERR